MVSELEVKIVGLDELNSVNNCVEENLSNTLQLCNTSNTLHISISVSVHSTV